MKIRYARYLEGHTYTYVYTKGTGFTKIVLEGDIEFTCEAIYVTKHLDLRRDRSLRIARYTTWS